MEPNPGHKSGDAELSWVELSEAATRAVDAGRAVVAEEYWTKACDIAREFNRNDPRLASSLNNLGVARRINGELGEAERLYDCALGAWADVSDWVEQMSIAPRARSSLFHLRMQRKHGEQYRHLARDDSRRRLPAGSAVTLNNLAELYCQLGRTREAETLYRKALEQRLEGLGETGAGVADIRRNLDSVAGTSTQTMQRDTPVPNPMLFSEQAIAKGWIVDKPAEFTDEGRLAAAILLAYLVSYRTFLHDIRPLNTSGNGASSSVDL